MRLDTAARYVCLCAMLAIASLLGGYGIAQLVAADLLAAPHYRQPPPRSRAADSDFMRALERGARLRQDEQAQPSGSSRL